MEDSMTFLHQIKPIYQEGENLTPVTFWSFRHFQLLVELSSAIGMMEYWVYLPSYSPPSHPLA
jgi:hypothetical protein